MEEKWWIIDPHVHYDILETTVIMEAMAAAGCGYLEPSFGLGQPRTSGWFLFRIITGSPC